ncbi:MAG: DUF4124 domain-containing protein [Pseudomonadota bacterium]
MRVLMLILSLLLVLWLPPGAEGGSVFRWRDAEGVVHYADRPGEAVAGAQQIDRYGRAVTGDVCSRSPAPADRRRPEPVAGPRRDESGHNDTVLPDKLTQLRWYEHCR